MECEPALRRIEETIGPFIGRHMAMASIQVQSERLGVKDGRITIEQLPAILDGIGKGMFVLGGQEKTKDLLQQIERSLGIEGRPASAPIARWASPRSSPWRSRARSSFRSS